MAGEPDSIRCLRCGAPLSVGLATHDFTCPYCGATEGAVDPALRARIIHAIELVRSVETRLKEVPPKLRPTLENGMRRLNSRASKTRQQPPQPPEV